MEFVSKQVAGLFLLYILHFAISDDSCIISKRMGKSSQYNDLVDDLTFAFPSYISNKCNSCSKIHSTDSKFEAHCLQNTSDGCNRRSYLAAHHLKENQTCALVCTCSDYIKIFNNTLKHRVNGQFSVCGKKRLKDICSNYFCTNDNGASIESEKSNKTFSNSFFEPDRMIKCFNSYSDSEVNILRAISIILAILLFLQTAYLLKTKTVYCNKPHTNEEKLEFIELQAAGESAAVDNEEQPATEEVNENYHACGASASTTSSQSSPREELCFGKEVIYSDGIQNVLDRDFTGPLADSFNIYERIAFPDEEPNDE